MLVWGKSRTVEGPKIYGSDKGRSDLERCATLARYAYLSTERANCVGMVKQAFCEITPLEAQPPVHAAR